MNVELESITCSYGGPLVLDDVTLKVGDAGWLAVIGPNGAGKSTLLRALAGLVAHQGTIRLAGEALPTRRREVARLIAYVPQRPALPRDMTVGDYVLLGRTPHLSYLATERPGDRAVAAAVLDRLELSHLHARRLGEVSGGEAQRAVLGRALAQEAPVLLLDEPTTGLDLGHQQRVLELVDELRRERGLTVVSSMHDLVLAGQFADQLALLVGGRVVADGAARDVLTEAHIERYYGATVQRFERGDSQVALIPVRGPRRAALSEREGPPRGPTALAPASPEG